MLAHLKITTEIKIGGQPGLQRPSEEACKPVQGGGGGQAGQHRGKLHLVWNIKRNPCWKYLFYENRSNLIAVRLQHSHRRFKIRRASLPGFQSQPRQGVLKRGKVLSDHFNWAKTLVAKKYYNVLLQPGQEVEPRAPPGAAKPRSPCNRHSHLCN